MSTYKFNLIVLLSLFFFSLSAVAQKEKTWLDNSLSICKKGKATHYLTVEPASKHFQIELYDLNHQLKMKGKSRDAKGEIFHGPCEFYHSNGKIESKGNYVDDSKVGIWERYDQQGNRLAERRYAAFNSKKMAYTYVDEMPVFEGGEENFKLFLKQKLSSVVNPTEFASKQQDIELGFVVSERGLIENLEFIKGYTPEWDVAALEELNAMPSWIPGKNAGENVRVYVRLPLDLSR